MLIAGKPIKEDYDTLEPIAESQASPPDKSLADLCIIISNPRLRI